MSANPSSDGSVSPSAGSYWYNAGSIIQISASPYQNYNFAGWSGSYKYADVTSAIQKFYRERYSSMVRNEAKES